MSISIKRETVDLIPVIVVEKITHPANVSYLVGFSDPVTKMDVPRRIFKKSLSEVTYIIVGSDLNGVEYNIGVNRIAFTQINLLDTLWTTR
jgi:hypothetical protein